MFMLMMIIISVHVINDRSNVNRTQRARARFVTVGALDRRQLVMPIVDNVWTVKLQCTATAELSQSSERSLSFRDRIQNKYI